MHDREKGPEIDVLIGRDFSLKFGSYITTHCYIYTANGFCCLAKGADWTTYLVVYLWADKKLRHQPASSTLIDLTVTINYLLFIFIFILFATQ